MGMRFGANMIRARIPPHLRTPAQRRVQSTAADAGIEAPQGSYLQRLWQSEVGPKTVHFWAPIMKVSP